MTTSENSKTCVFCRTVYAEGNYADRDLVYGSCTLCNSCCKAYDSCRSFIEDRLTKNTVLTLEKISEALAPPKEVL